MHADDWVYCRESLQRHSRTFAIPIGMLPAELERAITCAYLLCRIADTVEDTPDWGPEAKRRLYRQLQDALAGSAPASAFVDGVSALEGGDAAERELLCGLPKVMSVFDGISPALRSICREGVDELVGGMMVYSHREPDADGFRVIASEADLERYCYFVAGVIGELLTRAFLEVLPETDPASRRALRANAERFGGGLQLVNILRDLSADLKRGVCFVPRTVLDAVGLDPRELCEPSREAAVRAALEPLFDSARAHLDAAFHYTLAIPAQATAIRQFCLVPLWLAVATLEACRTAPNLLRSGPPVKLERARVFELIGECTSASADDTRLKLAYEQLSKRSVEQRTSS